MAQLTNYAEQNLLDRIFNAVSLTFPSASYVALHTADPTEAGNVAEVSASGYARQVLNPNSGSSPKWRLAATEGGGGYAVKNLDDVVFGPAGADWGSITHVSIWDNVSAGNPWFYGALTAARTVQSGGTLTFDTDTLLAILR